MQRISCKRKVGSEPCTVPSEPNLPLEEEEEEKDPFENLPRLETLEETKRPNPTLEEKSTKKPKPSEPNVRRPGRSPIFSRLVPLEHSATKDNPNKRKTETEEESTRVKKTKNAKEMDTTPNGKDTRMHSDGKESKVEKEYTNDGAPQIPFVAFLRREAPPHETKKRKASTSKKEAKPRKTISKKEAKPKPPASKGPKVAKTKAPREPPKGLERCLSIRGAYAGEHLVGRSLAQGLEICIVSGWIPPIRADICKEENAAAVGMAWRIGSDTVASAVSSMKEYHEVSAVPTRGPPPAYADVSHDRCLGQTCTCKFWRCNHPATCSIQIVSVGGSFLEKHPDCDRQALEELSQRTSPFAPCELLRAMKTHTLAVRPTMFYVNPVPTVLTTPFSGLLLDLRLSAVQQGVSLRTVEKWHPSLPHCHVIVLEVDDATLCPTLAAAVDVDNRMDSAETQMKRAIRAVLAARGVVEEKQVALCEARLKGRTMGQLKSLVQKDIRASPTEVQLLSGDRVRADVYTACVWGALFLCPGILDPVLQIFVQGNTSALKRLGVISVEDSVCWDGRNSTVALLGWAWVTQKHRHWAIPQPVMEYALEHSLQLLESPTAIASWSKVPEGSPLRHPRPRPCSRSRDQAPGVEEVELMSYLLQQCGSLAGDYGMLAGIHHDVSKGRLSLITRAGPRRTVMPEEHGVDQHAFVSLSHLLGDIQHLPPWESESPALGKRLGHVFGNVTGYNPRKPKKGSTVDPTVAGPVSPLVDEVRIAQRYCLALASSTPLSSWAVPLCYEEVKGKEFVPRREPLAYGVLSAAVGHVEVTVGRRMSLWVVLPVEEGAEEGIMIRPNKRDPTGAKKKDYFQVTDEIRSQAKAIVHQKRHKLSGPFAPGQFASYNEDTEEWWVDDQPWSELRVSIPAASRVPVLAWANAEACVEWPMGLILDAATQLVFCPVAGVVKDWDSVWLPRVMTRYGVRASMRVLGWIRAQWERVVVPVAGRDGKASVGQWMTFDGDAVAFQCLLHMMLFVPGAMALDPSRLPCLIVRHPLLLHRLAEEIHRLRDPTGSIPAPRALAMKGSPSKPSRSWASAWGTPAFLQEDATQPLRLDQAGLIDRLLEPCSSTGQLVHAACGYGKTRILSEVLRRTLTETPSGSGARYIVWSVPKGSNVESTKAELENQCGVQALHIVGTRSQAKGGCPLRPFHINLVTNGRLRDHREWLLDHAEQLGLVLDETDVFFATSEQASVAKELATLAPWWYGATATLVPNGKMFHVPWLKLLAPDLPITDRNILVALQRVHHESFTHGKDVRLEDYIVPFPSEDQDFLQRLQHIVGLGDFHKVFAFVLDRLDPAMVELGCEIIAKEGGVLQWAANTDHEGRLMNMYKKGGVRVGTFQNIHDPTFKCIVLNALKHGRGINGAERFATSVAAAYPSSVATDAQRIGRQLRPGQKSDVVTQWTVYMAGTTSEARHRRHVANHHVNQAQAAFLRGLQDKLRSSLEA